MSDGTQLPPLPPDLERIQVEVLLVLREIQELSGHKVQELTDVTVPLNDLEGFDSLNAEEAVVMLGERLEVDFADDFNPFVHTGTARPCRVSEMVKTIAEAVRSAGKVAR